MESFAVKNQIRIGSDNLRNQFSTSQLLALHYVYPLSLKKFQTLLQSIRTLDHLDTILPEQLANILHLTIEKANSLLNNYFRLKHVNLLEIYKSKKIQIIEYTNEFYPKSLLHISDPPLILYGKGDISLLKNKRKIAIIGSRKATDYTKIALDYLVPPLVKHQYVIVSGLAKGADSFAHEAAIKYGGKTIAVLGHGLFHIYPKENKKLADEIAKHHLLLSEYPPYVGVKKWHFPQRNRIISGLSKGVVITESTLKSGTLITAEYALEQGKDVFVVPGPIHSKLSNGTNYLLQEGAIPITDGYQILEHFNMFF